MLPAAIGSNCVCCRDKRTEIESNATATRGLVKLVARRRIALQTVHVLLHLHVGHVRVALASCCTVPSRFVRPLLLESTLLCHII